MEEKLIIDKDLFNELIIMMSSSNEHDVVMAISIIETADEWNKQNQIKKERLYETLRENNHIKNRYELQMKVWLANNDINQ